LPKTRIFHKRTIKHNSEQLRPWRAGVSRSQHPTHKEKVRKGEKIQRNSRLSNPSREFREYFASICEALGKLAKRVGITNVTLRDLLSATREPTVKTLAKLLAPHCAKLFHFELRGCIDPALKLSLLTEEKWADLEALAIRSPLSLTKPITTHPDQAIERHTPLSDFPSRRAAVRYAARYVLKTDIARFYHSIYTHSIPWAIHSKAAAKRDRTPNLWGNSLDKLIRDSQDGQTMGIPIGPDVSLLIAELLLSAVDEALVKRTGVRGVRYIDDYELSFNTLADAERVRGVLQELLGDYELALNSAKTAILELPLQLQEPWVSELGHFDLRARKKGQHTDLLRYFDRAFVLARSYPAEGVLKYAVGKAANLTVLLENRLLFQDFRICSSNVRWLNQAAYL
jgi:transcriptional regulator with XRE-family HTH domain